MQIRRKRILVPLALIALSLGPATRWISAQVLSDIESDRSVDQLQFVAPGNAIPEVIPPPADEASPTLGSAATASDPPFSSELPALDAAYQEPSGELMVSGSAGDHYGMPVDHVIVPDDVAPVFSTNNWFRGGYWYSQQEFMMLLRTDLELVHVATDPTSLPGGLPVGTIRDQGDVSQFEKIGSKTANFSYEPGVRLTLGHIIGRDVANRDHGIEVTFMGLFEYVGYAEISPVNPNAVDPNGAPLGIKTLLGSLEVDTAITNPVQGFPSMTDVVVPGFTNTDFQSLNYESDLNTFEVNYRVGGRPGRDRLVMQPNGKWVRHDTPSRVQALFAGFRYFRIDERFRYNSTTFRSDGGQTLPPATGFYQVDTDNNAVGLQLGGDFVNKHTDFLYGLRAKAGGLVNFMDRDSLLVTDLPGANNQLERSADRQHLGDTSYAVLFEAGLFGAYYLRPNTSVRASYDVMLINGVANAVENLGLMGTFPEFDVTGKALFHGASIGFEMTW